MSIAGRTPIVFSLIALVFAHQLLAGDHAYYPPPLSIHSTITQDGLAIFEIRELDLAKEKDTCTFSWKFGDGFGKKQSRSLLVKHHFLKPGVYRVIASPATTCRLYREATIEVNIPFLLKPIGESVLTFEQINNHRKPVTINGSANESAWDNAPRFSNFLTFPRGIIAPEATSVSVMSDRENLYVLFKSRKDTPGPGAKQRLRDGSMGSDNRVEVVIGTFSNDALQSRFTVNALGTQSDDFGVGRADRVEWKGDWKAAVVHTEDIWYTEFAIPIAILPRESSDTEITINFRRYHNLSRHWSAISGTRHDNLQSNNRSVKLKLPALIKNDVQSRTKPWTLMPYVLAGTNTPDLRGNLQDSMAYAGITARFKPVPETTFLLDLLPDFSQLERQFASINFSYSENSVNDVRPFFQEGRYYFELPEKFFRSSNIPNFYGGIKTFTQTGNNSLGSFVTFAPDNRIDGVVRALHSKEDRYTLEAAYVASLQQTGASFNESTTELEIVPDQNTAFNQTMMIKLDAGKEFGVNSLIEFGYASANSRETGKAADSGFSLEFESFYQSLINKVGFELNHYSARFDPVLGNLDDDLRGTQGGKLYVNDIGEFDKSLVTNTGYYIEGIYRKDNNDSMQRRGFYADVSFTFNHNIYVSPSIYSVDYRPVGTEAGSFLTDTNEDRYGAFVMDFANNKENTGTGFYYANGNFGGGPYRYFAPYVWWKPLQSLYLYFSYAKLQSFGKSTQFNLNVDYQLSRRGSLSLRTNRTNGTDYVRLSYKQRIRDSVDILATIEDREEEDKTAFVMKLVWTL